MFKIDLQRLLKSGRYPIVLSLVLVIVALLAGASKAAGPVLYDSIPAPYPGSFASVGFQATQASELGDYIQLSADNKTLATAVVSLTNWACENDFTAVGPSWTPLRTGTDPCTTTPGSSYLHPITLSLYAVDTSGANPQPGALIATKTKSVAIPFRPSWDSVNCTGAGQTPATDVPFGGKWYDPVLAACVHGYAFNVTFDFTGDGVVLPQDVVYGIAFNTQSYGAAPIGANGPYNSLNVSLNDVAPTVGTDFDDSAMMYSSTTGGQYCDGGTGGTGTFRWDGSCWAPYGGVIRLNEVEQCSAICYADIVNGDNANDGITALTAKKTIQAAVNQVDVGGQVIVAGGVYQENVTIPKALTVTGAGQTDNAAGTVLDGTGLTGAGFYVNSAVTNVTIQDLRIEDYALAGGSGIWANGNNDNFKVEDVTGDNNGVAGNNGGAVFMNGPVDTVLINRVTATNNRSRGIAIWNGFKTHITITNSTATGNNCCGIELQDGTASGVTVTGNTSTGNVDSGMSFIGLMAGAGPNVISGNTVSNNGRFGIEIKMPNGTGATSGDGSIVIENNTVSLTGTPADLRDWAGIAVMRRGMLTGNTNGNVDIPTGVVVRNNSVSGYQQTNGASNSTGFGIVVEGTNMKVTGNTLTNNDVGAQSQAGHLPYVANTSPDGDQSNLNDNYFGRGNSPVGCNDVRNNTFTGNATPWQVVVAGGVVSGFVTNTNTTEVFCTIQSAINDSDTVNGHTLVASASTFPENVIVNKQLTIRGANFGVSPNDPVTPTNPNGARVAESIVAVTGGGIAFSVQVPNVTIDGFKFTDSAVDVANVQSPIIGAGVNFGGDAPNVKIINNLFTNISRTAVYFNGPALMQDGTVDDNRVQDPTRPDTGCVGATAPGACGHQLFNLWKTDDLSFQGNVAVATAGNRDRVRLLNIQDSTDVIIDGNTARYTCIFTCISVAGTANNVTITNNDLVTDAGNVLQLHPTWTTGNVNVNHNILTTGADFPIVVDNPTADLDNVHINRNSISGTYHVRNGVPSATPPTPPDAPGLETLDVTCNWWQSAAGPTPANFFGPSNFSNWLHTSNLDGPCGGVPPVTNTCPVDPNVGPLLTTVLGIGQGSPTKGQRTRNLVIPNYQSVDSLYAQLAAVDVGTMNYVRFLPLGQPKIQIAAPTSPAFQTYAVDWWGTSITPPVKSVKGQFFWGAKGNKAPRAFILWPTYDTTTNYANVFETFNDSSEYDVYWDTSKGWTPIQTQTLDIPATAAPDVDLTVSVALIDVNKDKRSVILTVEAGGVSLTRIITVPNKGLLLNLEQFILPNVPTGTDEVTITLESPAVSGAFPFGGDSAAMIGAAANYECVDLSSAP